MLNTILRLRRDNDYNYRKIKDTFVPADGEICLVDTARDGLRAVCGDGISTFGELTYLDDLGTDFRDLDMLRIDIHEYISNRNRVESRAQILHGVLTNGIIRSVPYAMAKVKKEVVKVILYYRISTLSKLQIGSMEKQDLFLKNSRLYVIMSIDVQLAD